MTPTTTRTTQYKRAIGVFNNREDLEKAIKRLKDSSFDMNRVSVIAKDSERKKIDRENGDIRDNIVGKDDLGNKSDEGATAGAAVGGILGTIGGLLVGLGALTIPGIGPILLVGAPATAIATTLAGAGIGVAAGGLVGALVGLGIPEERAKVYSDHISQGHYLVIVTGEEPLIRRAEMMLRDHGIEEWEIFDAPDLVEDEKFVRTTENVATKHEYVPTKHEHIISEKKQVINSSERSPEVIIVDHRKEKREI